MRIITIIIHNNVIKYYYVVIRRRRRRNNPLRLATGSCGSMGTSTMPRRQPSGAGQLREKPRLRSARANSEERAKGFVPPLSRRCGRGLPALPARGRAHRRWPPRGRSRRSLARVPRRSRSAAEAPHPTPGASRSGISPRACLAEASLRGKAGVLPRARCSLQCASERCAADS